MVKSYLKYEQSACFGTVTSSSSNALWCSDYNEPKNSASRNTGVGRVYVGANEEVLCWDVKKAELLSTWRDQDCSAQVTALAQSGTDPDVFAVGYNDGSVRLWDSKTESVILKFDGHRSAVTVLTFDDQGVRLASGSRDTDIIVWDIVAEAGLFKLRGHKNQITGLHFLKPNRNLGQEEDGITNSLANGSVASSTIGDGFLLSTSKDALIKVWDVGSQYCVETHVTQANGECWSLGVSPGEDGCITGGNDGEVKVWFIDTRRLDQLQTPSEQQEKPRILQERGTLNRQGKDHAVGVHFHPKVDYVAIHGSERSVELLRMRSPSEVRKSLARKRRRKREKAAAEGDDDIEMADAVEEEEPPVTQISDIFVPHVIIRTGGKIRSFNWSGGRLSKGLQLTISTTNNQIEFYTVTPSAPGKSKKPKKDEPPEYNRLHAVEMPGHRTDVRAISLSSDDTMLATASSGSLKIWNVRTKSCLRTVECGYALCCAFLPGDKIVLVGNKNGELELYDYSNSTLIETVKAHDAPIWTMKVHPDSRSVVTGSKDNSAKFWNFEIFQEEIPGTKRTTPRLKLVQKRVLKMNDEILSLCFTPDSRLLAVSTLDNTVKVFFVDSLKLFLNLYGHKLPVLNISISSDSKLIATCSADKNVRLWGLDFGDCHKAFFAHDESIMQVSFIPEPVNPKEDGHLFFSASKDHLLKNWDGDKFEHIQKLSGHHGEIWAMAVSRGGDFVVTASHDKSIRVWQQTDELLFLEEERERELEEMYDQNLTANMEKDQADDYALADAADEENGVNGTSTEVVSATKQTSQTLTSSEKITEALQLCTEDYELMREYETAQAQNPNTRIALPTRHPLLSFKNKSAESHLLSVFEAIPSPSLHDALLLVTFSQLPDLFIFLSIWLEKQMNIHLTCRILVFLLKTHHKQIVASRELRTQLEGMKGKMRDCLKEGKDRVGFILAACKILEKKAQEEKVRRVEDYDAFGQDNIAGSAKKRGFVNVA